MAAIRGARTLIGLAQDSDMHPCQIQQCQDQFFEGANGVFRAAPRAEAEPATM